MTGIGRQTGDPIDQSGGETSTSTFETGSRKLAQGCVALSSVVNLQGQRSYLTKAAILNLRREYETASCGEI